VLGSFADKNPKAVDSLVRVVVRATKLLKDDPKRAAPLVSVAFGKGLVADDIPCTKRSSRPQTQFTSIRGASSTRPQSCRTTRSSSGRWRRRFLFDGLFALPVYESSLGEQLRRAFLDAERRFEVTRTKAMALAAIGFAIFLGIWELAPALGFVSPSVLPPPSALPRAFLRELNSGIWITSVGTVCGIISPVWCLGCLLGLLLLVSPPACR